MKHRGGATIDGSSSSQGGAVVAPHGAANAALAAQIERILAGASVGTLVFATDDGYVHAVNPAFRAFLAEEYRFEPLRGRRLGEVLPLHEEPELDAMIAAVTSSGGDSRRVGMRFPRIGRPEVAWDVELTAVCAEGDEPAVLVLSVVPSSESPEATAPSEPTERERELIEKIEEMQLLNDALIASVQQKHHFVTAISHRLRTPLTTIVGFGEMLAADEVPDEADRRMVHGDIVAAGQQMLGLIDDMIELARLDAGDLRLHQEHVDVVELLDDARDRLEALAASRRQRLAFEAPPAGLVAFTDARWTTEVILKLGMNALRFSPTGGTVALRAREFDETHIALDVADSGVGINAEDQSAVFEAFGGASDAGGQARSTGLELALAKRLVELQGGSITFASTRGIGTTFTVTLPKMGVPRRGDW